MRILLTMTAIGLATIGATAATATPTTHHRATRSDSGSAAVRALNEKSLQQASAGSTMTSSSPAMSDSGAAAMAPAAPAGDATSPATTPTDAAPMAPTTPAPPQ